MIRCRFQANEDDPRPIKFPAPYPFWISGYGPDHAVVIAYADSEEQVKEYWPEAAELDSETVDKIEFSSRFPKPDWRNK